jgi:hypothetical protein
VDGRQGEQNITHRFESYHQNPVCLHRLKPVNSRPIANGKIALPHSHLNGRKQKGKMKIGQWLNRLNELNELNR